ncbi:[FeFe] hydrogenase H-cluster maturation GTPase HydF [Anaerosporobacter faecicola]|uniref:[FeFe] hydrogenase H-cluster maturation GTPase HydF n=1 Tax=Anaerosporobacter faecicola TaxID=2718714 RepID=UPI001438CB67|nr:[FeFe] hydrogenase H-cluster maturation GTPase HydF [Anaerosporobacter faecicola]
MNSNLNATPSANRVHIAFYGKRNSGKSSIINAITGQQVSIVSNVAGTTTDPVYKPMEIAGIGPCMLIDTAGFDDEGDLGKSRVEKTEVVMQKTDLAVILFTEKGVEEELMWYHALEQKHTIVIPVINKMDCLENPDEFVDAVQKATKQKPVLVSAKTREGIPLLIERLVQQMPEEETKAEITRNLVQEGDSVLLVMPQDIQAPKGRLILPQVQVLRELLDKKCIITSVTTDKLEQGLHSLVEPPKLIITDSQVFRTVYDQKPKESMLTSFSMLYAAYKGDIDYYKEGAAAIDSLTPQSKVLIAECCTHAPLKEDIGREKLPRLLRNRIGQELTIDMVSGMDFGKNLEQYDLIIQCGACMFNRKYVMSRVNLAKEKQIPMTNYGVVLAYLNGILGEVSI